MRFIQQSRVPRSNIIVGLPQSAVNGFHTGSVLAATANAIEDDAKASGGDTIISMDGIQVHFLYHGSVNSHSIYILEFLDRKLSEYSFILNRPINVETSH